LLLLTGAVAEVCCCCLHNAGLLTVWLDILAPDATSANFIGLRLPQDMEQLPYRDIRR
jgi:hypothetical protein